MFKLIFIFLISSPAYNQSLRIANGEEENNNINKSFNKHNKKTREIE